MILIGAGIVFLLNSLGILSWNIWELIFRLWPVLLIAAGLDILVGRRSVWGSLLALALTLGVLAGVLWLYGTGAGTKLALPAEEVEQPLNGATEADVIIDPGVGTLHIAALPESANLVEGEVHLTRRERLVRDFTVVGEKATFTLHTDEVAFGPLDVFGGWSGQRAWDLGLTPGAPLRLEIDLGMGETDIDLTGLTVRGLDVEVGIGQTTIRLPEEGLFQARIQGAIGQTMIVLPEGLAARVHLDTGLAGRQLPDGYQCQDDTCASPDYETTGNRVDLEVSQAIGNCIVRQGR